MTDPNILNQLLIWPLTNLLLAVYYIFFSLHIPYTLGFSIIGLTVLVRLILYPLTGSQMKASKKMQDLAPHLSLIKEKHKGDGKRIQEETMRLYKEHGINPAAGCLPVLLQLPLLWALYSVLTHAVSTSGNVVAEVNSIAYVNALRLTQPWDTYFFGIPLGKTPSDLFSAMPLIVLVPALTAGLQFIQSKMMFASAPKKDKKKEAPQDFAQAFQSQSMYLFPLMIGFFSFTLPFGLSLYWNTFTLFGILQQYQLHGWGGMLEIKNKFFPTPKKK